VTQDPSLVNGPSKITDGSAECLPKQLRREVANVVPDTEEAGFAEDDRVGPLAAR
jgi:hypothetical protein